MQVLAMYMVRQLQWGKFCWTDSSAALASASCSSSFLMAALKLNYSK